MKFFVNTEVGILKLTESSDKNSISSIEFCFQKLKLDALTLSKTPPRWRAFSKCLVALAKGQGAPSKKLLSGLLTALQWNKVTPFQKKVYEAATKIPPGKVLSYGELATKIGNPKAARAVGQALKKNPFPLVIPCHRVIASTGKIGGFVGNDQQGSAEIRVKEKLLSLENSHCSL